MTSETDAPAMRTRREQNVASTREAIIDAFLDLAHTANAVTVSIPAVAARAGVSVRTVYRYFPSKDDLQNAAAYHFASHALDDQDIGDTTVANLEETLTSMWTLFQRRLPAVIAEHTTPAGRALRAQRLEDTRQLVRRQIDPALDDDTVDMLVALCSSSMFLELVDRMGHSPEHAASMATRFGLMAIGADVDQRTETTEGDEDD